MADVVLGFAGTAIGGAIGGPVGAKIGGFIGAALGKRLGAGRQRGTRLDDLKVSAASYGSAIPLIYGPENRISGTIIWSTDLIETEKNSGGKGGPAVTEYSYRLSCAVLISGRPITELKKVWANSKVIYDVDGGVTEWGMFSAVTVYTGTSTQLPDPTIESYLGVGNAPAYINSAYVVFTDLQLADFGNRMPNFEFLIEADTIISASEVVMDIVTRCEVDPNTASYCGADGDVRGMVIAGESNGIDAINPLTIAHAFDIGENAGALVCVSRNYGPAGVIPLDDLAGHNESETRPEAIKWERQPESTLPQEVTVTFSDPDMNYQGNAQSERRLEGSAASNDGYEVPLTLTADEGKACAARLLWDAHIGRTSGTCRTDDRHNHIQVGRRYLFETPHGLYEPLRITRKTRGDGGIIELSVIRDSSAVFSVPQRGQTGNILPNIPAVPGVSVPIMLDIPLLLEQDAPQATGFYYGAYSLSQGFRGASFRRALSASGSYSQAATISQELTAGLCDDVLGVYSDISDEWDDESTVTVTLYRSDMTLESKSDEEVLSGENAAYIGAADGSGGEIIQYGVATQITDGVYELSHLLRGRRGTTEFMDSHGPGEMFVALEIGPLQRLDFGSTDIGQERFYKAVSLLTDEADASAVAFTNNGAGTEAFTQ